jgi:hypothetical protein
MTQHLIGIARPLYASEPLGINLDATVYVFDATTIDLLPSPRNACICRIASTKSYKS